jgi:hypothetical protein
MLTFADFSLPTHVADKATHKEAARPLGVLVTSGTAMRCSSDARSTPTPKGGTPSPSSLVTRGAWKGPSFEPSTSYAGYRPGAGTLPHPRF